MNIEEERFNNLIGQIIKRIRSPPAHHFLVQIQFMIQTIKNWEI